MLICSFLALNLAIEADPTTRILIDEVLAAPAATGVTMAIGLLVLPRLSLVMPALALGERLSLRRAWRITQGNTLRLGMATALCMLPAVTLAMLVPLLMLLVRAPWWLDFSWPQIVAFMWAWKPVWDLAIQLSQSYAYAIFVALAYGSQQCETCSTACRMPGLGCCDQPNVDGLPSLGTAKNR